MRIGVITFFNNGNYGSELQAYAMNSFLESHGHSVCFCKFRTRNLLIKALEMFRDRIEEQVLKHRYPEYAKMRAERQNSIKNAKRISPSLHKTISDFSTSHLHSALLPRTFYSPRLFDCWICGSDQVWTALKIPFQKERFLPRVPSEKKIAYAVSLGPNKTPDYFARKARRLIKEYHFLSFRENSGREYVKQAFGLDSELVLDPTMLVGSRFWEQAISKVCSLETPNSYGLCYFLGRIPDEYKALISKYNGNRKLLVLAYQEDAEELGGVYVPANPLEFVKLVANAAFIFTDSFHGTVFSLLMKKDFLSFERSHSSAMAQTNRLTGLLGQLGISDRFVVRGEDVSDNIKPLDYQLISGIIEEKRVESSRFLEDCLNKVSNTVRNE